MKLVVSIPGAPSASQRARIVADDSLKYEKEHKEKRALPLAKISKHLAEKLSVAEGSVIMVKVPGEGKVHKFHLVAKIDEALEGDVVKVPTDILFEAVGADTVEGEVSPSKAFQHVLSKEKSASLIGLKIGDQISASIVGLKGKLVITGGTDSSGFPMRPDILGGVKKRVLLSGPPGYKPEKRGARKRKTVRGNMITSDIVQVNTVLVPEQG